MIDEVQYALELFIDIKMYVDKHKNNRNFWLTGSQAFQMIENITESLAGNGAVICLASDVIPIDRMNCYVPAWVV